MRTEPLPLDALRSVAERGCTGEFICASPTVEVHVYLQRGRIAWATDSEHPFVFTRQLQKTAQIDPESFRDILDSCRREKRPLGETLVSWGVATWDEVKDALRHQIELALDVLHHGGPAQTLFLDRTEQFAQYESGLTFDLAELLGDRDAAHAPSQGSEAPRPSDGSMSIPEGTRSVGPVSLPSGGQHARRLLDAVDGMLWAEHLEGTTVIEAAPEPSERPRFAPEIVERTVLDGAEVVALRAPEGTLAGALLSSSSSLWCRLTPEATVGLAISALAAFTGTGTPASDSTNAHLERGPVWVIGGDTPITTALQDFLGRAPETLATLLTDVDNGGHAALGARSRPSTRSRSCAGVRTSSPRGRPSLLPLVQRTRTTSGSVSAPWSPASGASGASARSSAPVHARSSGSCCIDEARRGSVGLTSRLSAGS